MTNQSAVDVLVANGFIPDLHPDRAEDFVRACKEGLDDVVTAFLDIGMSPNARRPISLETALIAAAEGGHASTIELLVARGADVEARDSSDDTALRTALNWGHPDVARVLIAKGANANAVNKYDETALEHAIDDGKNDDVALLLELGADPAFTKNGRGPMRAAIKSSDVELVQLLLDKGCPATLVLDDCGVTALHEAARESVEELVELLVERGARGDVRDAFGLTAVDYGLMCSLDEDANLGAPPPDAYQRARAQVWQHLEAGELDEAFAEMEKGDVSVDARNEEHLTPLMSVAEAGDVDAVKRLLDRGADVCARTGMTSGDNALSKAAAAGHTEIVALLLDTAAAHGKAARDVIFDGDGKNGGVDSAVWEGHKDVVTRVLDACTSEERARFQHLVRSAVMQKNVEMTKLLVEKNVPLDHHDENGGDTALIGAVTSWHDADVARALIEGGADVNACDQNRVTVLHKICGHHEFDDDYAPTLRLLLERGARLDAVDWLGNTPVQCALDKEECSEIFGALVDELVESGKLTHSWATLSIFVDRSDVDALTAVLDGGAVGVDPPAGVDAQSALQRAADREQLEIARVLVERGANVNRNTKYANAPLVAAVSKGNEDLVTLLLEHGADPNATSESGYGAIHAAASEHAELLDVLAQHGARFDGDSARANAPIIEAARGGKLDAVQFLVEHGAPVDVRDSYGGTPLVMAIEEGHDDVAGFLIEHGASPSLLSRRSGETPLTAAAKSGSVDVVRALLAKGGDLEAKNKEGEDAVTIITRRKALRTEFADVLAARGIDVSVPKLAKLDAFLTTCSDAWSSIYRGDVDGARAAIEAGAVKVDEQDAWGVTPLMCAVLHRSTDLVAFLLEKGANPIVEDHAGARAWDYTGFQRDSEIDELLSQHTKDEAPSMDRLNAQAARHMAHDELKSVVERGEIKKLADMLRDKKAHPFLGVSGRPILFDAIDADDEDMVGALLELGLPADVKDGDGNTPLASALSDDKTALVAKLIEGGASTSPRAFCGAVRSGNVASVALMLKHGANVNARDDDGSTPLGVAVSHWYQCADVARALLEHGADVDAFDQNGQTALHTAVDDDSEDAARLLLKHGASWDAVDHSVDDAISARALLEERDMDADWPGDPPADDDDDDDGDDDDSDDEGDDDEGDDDDRDDDDARVGATKVVEESVPEWDGKLRPPLEGRVNVEYRGGYDRSGYGGGGSSGSI